MSLSIDNLLFQRFELVIDEWENIPQKEKVPQAGYKLLTEMMKSGYVVLTSGNTYGGVPGSIILAGRMGMDHKKDFYEITQELRIPFSSSDFYTLHSLINSQSTPKLSLKARPA